MAASGKEGLLIYNEGHPDIIILDIQMPVLCGWKCMVRCVTLRL